MPCYAGSSLTHLMFTIPWTASFSPVLDLISGCVLQERAVLACSPEATGCTTEHGRAVGSASQVCCTGAFCDVRTTVESPNDKFLKVFLHCQAVSDCARPRAGNLWLFLGIAPLHEAR